MVARSVNKKSIIKKSQRSSWNSENLATSIEQVSSLLNFCDSICPDPTENQLGEFLEAQIQALISLYIVLKAEEEAFYKRLGCNSLQEVQNKIDEIDSSGLINMVSGQRIADELINSGKSPVDLTQPVKLWISDPKVLEKIKNSLGKQAKDISAREFVKLLNNLNGVTTSTGEKITFKFYTYSQNNKGLQQFIAQVSYNPNKKKKQYKDGKATDLFEIKLNDQLIDPAYENKLKQILSMQYTSGELIKQIKTTLHKHITNDKYWKYVEYEIDKNIDKYDLNSGTASITGFLGEVRNNAILNILFGSPVGGASGALPTGNLKGAQGEIAIDSIIEAFGFQVKNYKNSKSSVSFGNFRVKEAEEGMGIVNFIDNRMRAYSISEALKALYGAYQYNQIASDNNFDTNRFSGYRKNIEQMATEKIKPVIESYSDNIIKVGDEFTVAGNNLFKDLDTVYYNTFYMIGNRLVPSSAIILNLINSIKEQKNQKLVALEKYFVSNSNSPTYEEDILNGTISSRKDALKQVKVKYEIKIRIGEILEAAYNSI